jgi:hypothetical protein
VIEDLSLKMGFGRGRRNSVETDVGFGGGFALL